MSVPCVAVNIGRHKRERVLRPNGDSQNHHRATCVCVTVFEFSALECVSMLDLKIKVTLKSKTKNKMPVKVIYLCSISQALLCYTGAEIRDRLKGNAKMESSSIVGLVQALTSIHHSQQQAVISLHVDQEQHVQALLQAQQKDWQVLWALLEASGTPAAAAPLVAVGFPHISLIKMGLQDKALVDLFAQIMEVRG